MLEKAKKDIEAQIKKKLEPILEAKNIEIDQLMTQNKKAQKTIASQT